MLVEIICICVRLNHQLTVANLICIFVTNKTKTFLLCFKYTSMHAHIQSLSGSFFPSHSHRVRSINIHFYFILVLPLWAFCICFCFEAILLIWTWKMLTTLFLVFFYDNVQFAQFTLCVLSECQISESIENRRVSFFLPFFFSRVQTLLLYNGSVVNKIKENTVGRLPWLSLGAEKNIGFRETIRISVVYSLQVNRTE